jgi:hypothetical protein
MCSFLKITDISEEHAASILKLEEYATLPASHFSYQLSTFNNRMITTYKRKCNEVDSPTTFILLALSTVGWILIDTITAVLITITHFLRRKAFP